MLLSMGLLARRKRWANLQNAGDDGA